jgi:hypothetical protein
LRSSGYTIETSFPWEKMVRGAGFEPATPSV